MSAATIFDAPVEVRRHTIQLHGACSIDGGPDIACVAREVSLSSLRIEAAERVERFDPVTLNLPQIGLVDAVIADVFEAGFELKFDPAPQSKLGIYVRWLERDDSEQDERREFQRMVPLKRLTFLQHGRSATIARISDLSRSGVAFTSSQALDVGESVRIGACWGRVVRAFDGGAAVKFDELIDETVFDVMINLDRIELTR